MIKKIICNKTKECIIVNTYEVIDNNILINGIYKLRQRDQIEFICQSCNKYLTFKQYYKTLDNQIINNRIICKQCHKEETNLKNFGCRFPSQNKDILNKMKATNIERYGVDNPQKNIEIKNKKEQTNLERYGIRSPLYNKDISDQIKKINIEKYGYENPAQSQTIKNKIKINKSIYYYNHIKERLTDYVEPQFSISDYKGTKNLKYKWLCKKCNNIFEDYMKDGKIPRCSICYPLNEYVSLAEKEISNWLKDDLKIIVQENNRTIIKPYELDLYLPNYSMAIEFNGLYYHSQISGNKSKNYHLNKTKLCQDLGIQLIHIFEDEWIEKRNIAKSIIKSKLNLYDRTIYARKCEIKKIDDNSIIKQFLNENHLQGYVNKTLCYGLFYNNELVSMMGFKYDKNKDIWELNRFCNKINCKIIGGFSRLLKYFERKNQNQRIITFADLRYSIGDVYLKNGFILDHISKPNYFYLNIKEGYSNRYHRRIFQKNKLKFKFNNFSLNLTEWENMQLNGYDRIFDCGNMVFYKNK